MQKHTAALCKAGKVYACHLRAYNLKKVPPKAQRAGCKMQILQPAHFSGISRRDERLGSPLPIHYSLLAWASSIARIASMSSAFRRLIMCLATESQIKQNTTNAMMRCSHHSAPSISSRLLNT